MAAADTNTHSIKVLALLSHRLGFFAEINMFLCSQQHQYQVCCCRKTLQS